jgi:hypothetical protein
MTDDEARAAEDDAPSTGQPGEKPRRSRRRGKRSKNRSAESQPTATAAALEDAPQPERAPQPAAPSRGNRKAVSPRSGFLSFNDGLDRFVCLECLRFLPEGYPVQHRRGVATVPLRHVDHREGEILLCNGLHDGPCTWPDGDVVELRVVEPASVSPESAAEPVAAAEMSEPSAPPEPGSDEESSLEQATSEIESEREIDASVMQLTESP